MGDQMEGTGMSNKTESALFALCTGDVGDLMLKHKPSQNQYIASIFVVDLLTYS